MTQNQEIDNLRQSLDEVLRDFDRRYRALHDHRKNVE